MEKRTIVLAEASAEGQIQDTAERKLQESAQELTGISGIIKRVWKHNIWREVSIQNEKSRIRREISKTGNIFYEDEDTKDETLKKSNQAVRTVVNRFAHEYDDVIHTEAGERRKKLEDGGKEGDLKDRIKELISKFATKDSAGNYELDDATFEEERNRLLSDFAGTTTRVEEERLRNELAGLETVRSGGGLTDDQYAKARERIMADIAKVELEKEETGKVYADNLAKIAREIRNAVDHGEKIDEILDGTDIVIGRAKLGARTEAEKTRLDRLIEKVQATSLGRFLNKATIATAIAGVYSVGTFFSKSFVRSKAAAVATFGGAAIVSAGLMGFAEKDRLEAERRQYLRDVAKGKTFDEKEAPRRKELKEYGYDTKSAKSLISDLESQLYSVDPATGEREVKVLVFSDLVNAMRSLAEIDGRIQVSDRHKVDLISYSDESRIEEERLHLDIVRATARRDIKLLLERDEFKREIPPGKTAQDLLDSSRNLTAKIFLEGDTGVEAKDKLFNKMRNRRAAVAGAKALAVGLTLGVITQEAAALFQEGKTGIVEGYLHTKPQLGVGEQEHVTALESLRRWMGGEGTLLPPGSVRDVVVGGHHFLVPEGVDFVRHADHTVSLIRGGEVLGDHMTLNPDGTFTEESKRILAGQGVVLQDSMENITDHISRKVKVPAREFAANNPRFHKIHHQMWMDNDTPAPVFDKNELKLHYGGLHGSGLDKHGNIVYTIKNMTPGGSYHGRFSADAMALARAGKMKMMLYLDERSQQYAAEVPIDASGNAIIPKGSELERLFFKTENGHVKFLGRYAEVVQSMGFKDGVEQIRELATDEGRGIKNVPGNLIEDIVKRAPVTRLGIPADYEIDLPPFIPLVEREPLERARSRNFEQIYYFGYGNQNIRKERLELYEKVRSETLKKDPKAKLDYREEVKNYLAKSKPEHLARVATMAAQVGPMEKTCKAAICIPVAGHQEGKNIYESLKNYTKQTAKPEEYEIVLFVNHPDKDASGKEIQPDETLSEIDRFKKDHPDIKIQVMYEKLPIQDAKIGKIRKMLVDATLLRQQERGGDDSDLIIISNDADNKGISPKYVETFINKFENDPKTDGLLGQLDWDPESYQKYPAIHIGTRLFQYLSIIGRHRSGGMASSGANSAFRSGIYAAIGGYRDEFSGGEDVAIREAIVTARKNNESFNFAGPGTRLFTSSRRAIDALKSGLAPVEQWDKGFSVFDDEIRKMTLEKGGTIDYDDAETQEKLKKSLEYIINRTLNVYEAGQQLGKDSRYYQKALGLMGIKYTLDGNGDVVISNIGKLVDGLKAYQKEGVLIRDARSGNADAVKKLEALYKEKEKQRKEKLSKAEAEQRTAKEKIDKKFSDFSAKDTLVLQTKARAEKVDDLIGSKIQEKMGDFVVCRDRILSNKKGSKVFFAYRPGTNELLVAKETSIRTPSPESFLKSVSFADPVVRLPLETIKQGDRMVRFYQAGDMDLEKYLEEKKKLSPRESLSIIIRASNGVRALHEAGVANVDFAPLNIIANKNGIKMIDLDGAGIDTLKTGTFINKYLGQNRFTGAPELLQESARYDKTVDIYAAGANLYRFIEGKWPYDEETKTEKLSYEERMKAYKKLHESGNITFTSAMPERLRKIIRKAMDPVPAKRYQSMSEFMIDTIDAYEGL